MDIHHSQLVTKILKNRRRQSFCEDICKLQGRWDWEKFKKARGDFLTDYMTIYLDVLCAFMEDGISGNLDCGLIIAIDGGWLSEVVSKVLEKVGQPLQFAGGRSHGSILSLRGTTRDR